MSRLPGWAKAGRGQWRWNGSERPPFAQAPLPGQESVWDYPRPPRLEPEARRVVVTFAGEIVADTTRAVRVLETASAPTVYIPREDVVSERLEPAPGTSHCEWKGTARYWTVRATDGRSAERAGWSYDDPFEEFAEIAGYLSFYPARVECRLGEETVRPQGGGFYGGWVTSDLVGPMKGDPGTGGW